MSCINYPFPNQPEATAYQVFPQALEDDDQILFHATPSKNAPAILKDGFKIPDPSGAMGLASISFSKRSVAALTHAMHKRETEPGDWIIFAVRYETLEKHGLKNNLEEVHDFTLDPMPAIVGSCTVPASYKHI